LENLSLIADTGIQFLEFNINLSEDSKSLKFKQKISFIEEDGEVVFTIPQYDDEKDCYIDRFNPQKEIEEHQVTTIKSKQALSCFEGQWLPFPIFARNHNATTKEFDNGPFGWCRIWIGQLPSNENFTHSIILAFDTKYDFNNSISKNNHLSLAGSDTEDCVFSLAEDILELDEFFGEEWVDDILLKSSKSGAKIAGIKESYFKDNPYYHIGLYLSFLKMIKIANVIPNISVHFPKKNKNIEVDLVLDIGNSRSCGLVLETSQVEANHSFSFSKASVLKLRNMQQPSITYEDAFEMQCEFIKADFGDISIPDWKNCFEWSSIVRVGQEAVNRAISAGSTGVNTGMSSPKRYLWDKDKRETSWYYNIGNSNKKPEILGSGSSLLSSVSINSDGNISDIPHMQAKYSRKSLMTFALIEIILQASTYINSHEFRNKRGSENLKRLLNRIVLTSPTAMLNTDKKTFRLCANNAVEILQEYYKSDENSMFSNLVVLPSEKDVITNPEDFEDLDKITKKDWGYDEATCAQLSFIYGEITSKYQNNAKLFFSAEGKKREIDQDKFKEIGSIKDFNFKENDNAVTIASLDIGGGTTDLMICTYRDESSSATTVLTPFPEFYEGFNIAGDDILKRVVERVIIPTIRKKADELNCRDSASAINFLFGDDMGEHTAKDKEYRKLFASQFALPIAMYALNHAKEKRITTSKKYKEILDELGNIGYIKSDIVDHINNYLDDCGTDKFNLFDIHFVFNIDEINSVISQVVQPMISKLSGIIGQFDCDYLLLAGRPSSLPIIQDIINRYIPVTPDKVIPLGNYRIGKWYPFAKGSGMISDPKTTIAVGAAIGLMAGSLGRLEGFRLNTLFLKNNVQSTARYVGGLDIQNKTITDIWFEKDDEHEITFDGPMFIGMKQMKIDSWLSTPMYKITYKDNLTAKSIVNKLPLKVTLERSENNPEVIWGGRGKLTNPKQIIDKNGDIVSSDSLVIKPQTLINDDGHWIDTGIFHLSMF